jgi:hypothetical protein
MPGWPDWRSVRVAIQPGQLNMHMAHAKVVLDALHLREGQNVLIDHSGAAKVTEIKHASIVFRLLDTLRGNDEIELSRQQVQKYVRV